MSNYTHFSVYLTYCQDRNNLWTLNKVVKSNSDYHLKEVKGGHFSQYLNKVVKSNSDYHLKFKKVKGGPFLPVIEKSEKRTRTSSNLK